LEREKEAWYNLFFLNKNNIKTKKNKNKQINQANKQNQYIVDSFQLLEG
jgi:hypothetical protein